MSITARCSLAFLHVKGNQPAHVRLTQCKLTACFIDNAAVNFRVKNWHHLAEGTHNFTAGVRPPKSNTLCTALETTFATGLFFFFSITQLLTAHQRLCRNCKALWNIGKCYTVV